MRTTLKIVVVLLLAGYVARLQATVPEGDRGQYQTIRERNVFGLRPAAVEQGPAAPQVPLPKITLTGITTILGNKRALMKVAPGAQKPATPAQEQSLILTEGQREGEIEVLQIDEKAGSVKVNNSGTVMLLTFEKDGAKLPATASHGIPLPVPSALPAPGVGATVNPLIAAKLRQRGFLSRTPGSPAGAVPGFMPSPAASTPPPAQANSALPPGEDLTAEERAIITELQRQANAEMPAFPPLPSAAGAATPTTPGATPPASSPSQSSNLVPQ